MPRPTHPYLRSTIKGSFFYLYMILDVWSRKIVGWEVYPEEDSEYSASLFRRTCKQNSLDPDGLVLHSDNGSPMKGSTMLATLEALGVQASFSRPRVSNDNAFSEAAFRTLKYRPDYPEKPFETIAAAREWVASFVNWYNNHNQHSAIAFVTPEERHSGRDLAILEARRELYAKARAENPLRWSRSERRWERPEKVTLNRGRSRSANPPQGREEAGSPGGEVGAVAAPLRAA